VATNNDISLTASKEPAEQVSINITTSEVKRHDEYALPEDSFRDEPENIIIPHQPDDLNMYAEQFEMTDEQ